MAWDDGLAPDGTRVILCGLSYRQIMDCAGMNQGAAAKRLGVNYNYFNQVCLRLSLGHWFPKPKQTFTRCITQEDVVQAASEGYTQKDAAYLLGVSERYFKRLVADWKLNHLFPNSGKAAAISRRGYCV